MTSLVGCDKSIRAVGRRGAALAAAVAAASLLTACGAGFPQSTRQTLYSTVTAPAAPTPSTTEGASAGLSGRSSEFYRGALRGDGVFSVEGRPLIPSGVDGVIPWGRYRVEVLSSAGEGAWMRCRSVPCGPAHPQAAIVASQLKGPDSAALLEINPNDVAVWLSNVNLTPVS